MMRWKVAAGAILMATMAGNAHGTDLSKDLTTPDMKVPEISASNSQAPEVSVKETQGWYVRGDAGYAFQRDHNEGRVSGSGVDGSTTFDSNRFSGGAFSGDLGVGYQFNDLFRADVTGNFFSGDSHGRFSSDSACAGGAAGTGCRYGGSASYGAAGLMANSYVDLGTLAGFTPYVGGGLGATHVGWGDFNGSGSCTDSAVACGGSASTQVRYGGDSDWRFTYALMAGVSYDITPSIKLDVGYRYQHIAGGDAFSSAADGASGRDGALIGHEIRVGLRVVSW